MGNGNIEPNKDSGAEAGAGANAGSRVDMKFGASDPLSELVWSPQNGVSLKCADCSFTDKKSSLLWYAGPSNIVLSPSQNLTAGRSSTDKLINKDNFIVSQGTFHVRSEMADRDPSARTPESDAAVKPVCGLGREDVTADEVELDVVRNEPSSWNPTVGGRDFGHENQTSAMVIVLDSEVHPTKECEGNNTIVLASPGRGHEGSAPFLGKESKGKVAMTIGVHPLERLESISENDVQTLISENVHGAEKKILASESALGIKYSSQQNEEIIPKDKTVSDEDSPTNSRIPMFRRKGKEKALSDGDVNGRMSKEENDSHESVESCNSTGLFSTGKKRWNFEQQLIVGSKRVKKQIHESPGSASHTKQDSSFMKWISNMMKGFSKSSQEVIPSLAHTLAHPNHDHESPDHKLITYNKNQGSGCRNVGFQSIFQSLYCPNTKVLEKTLDNNYQTELELGNRLCDISFATPIACHGHNNNLCKQFRISNDNFTESTSGKGADPAIQPKISSANFACSRKNSKGNKNSCNMTSGKVRGGATSNSSMDKHKTSCTQNTNSEPLSEVKTTHNFGHGNDPLGSLWITRFTPKSSLHLLNLQGSSVAHECVTNYHSSHYNDLNIVETGPLTIEDSPIGFAQESESCAPEIETSVGFNRIKGHNDQKSVSKLNPILPSERFKSSLPSGFARKLNAFKHIMPPHVTDNAACATIACFFCGKKGHHLRNCSEIADNELEYLLRNISSYNGTEELPCLCIRCFQLNHWAVACPNASSSVQNQLECGMQFNKKNEESTKLLDSNRSPFQACGAHTVCDRNDPRIETDPDIKLKMTIVATSDRMITNANLVEDYIPSSSGGNKLKENQIMPLCNLVNNQISEVPKGIFDVIKGLRLSRSDILKWMNSHMSLAHLNGFFLRLRLGKWEEGLGGTGYYVACITGAERGSSKNSISVNVGGINCLVESQYISNHDFLEEELMAWWCATAKSGDKSPCEEELRIKLEERKILGM
ncbi:uncharacterized protein LOC116130767 [Pistacia vera]|uniref:uncharacterized protein LOC116130767 n=1 Tax=Pistacia vera TaxID=55513 RepID=UPI0012633081|nr:uncharacterized protein LOC116130767 [Pistacia vera]